MCLRLRLSPSPSPSASHYQHAAAPAAPDAQHLQQVLEARVEGVKVVDAQQVQWEPLRFVGQQFIGDLAPFQQGGVARFPSALALHLQRGLAFAPAPARPQVRRLLHQRRMLPVQGQQLRRLKPAH
eukprot:CAMPEP_0173354726 /NCGR_PEP_ID=MMETSP1144-20121109/17355_1 /TAXON_ID=483371 /ORGANISM="non described non described, Strain CCMP2298" /LENGTH=125 /DNA_ID=CAMNT_0014303327 /DNA_START=213 /DNA_END=591 /DNA_ORIENTATION=-